MTNFLSDYAELVRGKTYKSALCSESEGIPLLGLGAIEREGGFKSSFKRYQGDTDPRTLVNSGDLFFSLKDLTQAGHLLGSVARVPESISHGRLTQDTLKLSLSDIDPNYVYWVLRSPQARRFYKSLATGTTNLGLAREDFLSLPIPLFTAERKFVVELLERIESKIEINQKMNQTLEEIAKAIFKSWFVDFDPVQAKMEGRPTGLPPEIDELFPDELVDSEIGEIPKGWSISCIGEHADVIDCLHSKKPTLLDDGFNFLQLKQIGDDGLLYCDGMSKISQVDYEKWTSRIEVTEGDCIVTNVGRVGAYARIPRKFTGAIGRNITAIRPNAESQMDFFIADYLSSPAYEREKDLKTDTGTILDALNVKNIPKLRFIYSALSLIECHRKISRSIWQRRELLVEENQILAKLRDTLLPKLISGELRIPDAEKSLEEAGI